MMLKYALLSYLCLLIGVQCKSEEPDDFMKSYFRSPVSLPEDYLIAPEASLDGNSFAVLHYQEIPTEPLKVLVQLYILSELGVDESKKCSVNLTAGYEVNRIGVSDFHRLSNDKLVFTWYNDVQYKTTVDRRYNVEVKDMLNCQKIDVRMNNFRENPIVVSSRKTQVLDLLLNDKVHCRNFGGQCRMFFNFAHDHIGRPHPLNIKYNWTTIQVQRVQDRDILIYGQKGSSFKVSRLEMITDSSEQTFLKVIGSPNMDVVATGLSACWNVHPGTSYQVKCVQFNQRMNDFILNQNINIYQDLNLIDVHPTRKGELLLIVKRDYCRNEDECWKLSLMKIKEGASDPETTDVYFPCTGDQKNLVVFSSLYNSEKNKIDIHYACRYNNGYTYSYLEI